MKKNAVRFTSIVLAAFFLLLAIPARGQLTEDEKNTINIVRRTKHSVVFITNIQLVRDFYFEEEAVARGTGSGFVWDNLGHIVTNFHVIEDGDIFNISAPDREDRRARLVGKDPSKDIAVLRIEEDNRDLEPLQIGTSTTLLVGQKVIAIGNPFGFDHTVTTGIVSALGRKILGAGKVTISDMIQTDASINPGNSGGPLLNSRGELIGMNTVIASRTGQSSGVGFAIPVETIRKIVPQLIEYGRVIRPGLGITYVRDELARRARIVGVVLMEVPRRSSAYQVGMRGLARNRRGQLYAQDIIVGVNDITIRSYDDLYNALENFKIGDMVILKVERNDKVREVRIRLVRE